MLSFSFDINSNQLFFKSKSQFSVILKIAISQVEPNLFFKLLSILISSYLSHSKNNTVSTRCSSVFGQARFQSFVICQIIIIVILCCFQYSTSFSATSFTCDILHEEEFILLEVITEILSIITSLGLCEIKVSKIFSRLFSQRIDILFQDIESLLALADI